MTGPVRTWCCHTPITGPHVKGCNYEPREDEPIDYTGPVVSAPWHLPLGDDVDWDAALATGPGRLFVLPDVEIEPAEPAIPVPDEVLATAQAFDAMWTQLLGGTPFDGMTAAIRAYWLAAVGPRWCDCPMDPHHRWNCPMTPTWVQTIRDLDTNPWTVITRKDHP